MESKMMNTAIEYGFYYAPVFSYYFSTVIWHGKNHIAAYIALGTRNSICAGSIYNLSFVIMAGSLCGEPAFLVAS